MDGKRQSREKARDPNRSRVVKRPPPPADPTAESVPPPPSCRRRSRDREDNNNNNNKRESNEHKNDAKCRDAGESRRCRVAPTPRFAQEDTATYGYAQTLRCGDLVWVSGTVANDERGRLVKGGIRTQARQVFDNLDLSLRSAGCRGLEDIVQLDAAIVDAPRNAPGFVAVRSERMPPGTYTSMATGAAALLAPGALVEMRCVAIVGRK